MKKFLGWSVIVLVPLLLLSQSRAEREQELVGIREKLTQVKRELASLSQQEKGVLAEIKLLEEQVTLTRRLMSELESFRRATRSEIDSLATTIDSLGTELDKSKDNLRIRLVSLYKRGQFYDLEVVFGAESATEVYDRLYYTRYAARAENQVFDRLLGTKHELQAREDSLAAYNHEIAVLIAEKKAIEDSLGRVQRRSQSRLTEIQSSQHSKQQLQTELADRKRRLEQILASMESQSSTSANRRPTGTVIEQGRGNLPWPVSSRKVIAPFGTITHPRYRTQIFNDGIDIDCSGSQTVKAIHEGSVRVAGNFSGFGLLVILDHNDGYYSVYSNLDEIHVSVNARVSQRQTLGTASDYLHFSITRGDEFKNPIDYLR